MGRFNSCSTRLFFTSVKQLVHYANQSTFVINPRFLSYSQSKYFSANKHLCTQASPCARLFLLTFRQINFTICLVTQGFRALLILLHTCRSVSVFGFTGTGGWYYDKRTNRRRSDKGKHTGEGQRLQGNSDSDSQSDEEGVLMPLWHGTPVENSESGSLPAKLLRDLPMHPRSLVASHGTTERRLRSLLATPSGHKLKYERTCLQRLVTYGAVRHHAMATKTAAVT